MSTFSIFLFLILIVAFLLVLAIMVQNPKGGDCPHHLVEVATK